MTCLVTRLEDAGIKLSCVATDIVGVSGRAMIKALIAGDRDAGRMADLARRRVRVKIPQPTEALFGRFTEHRAFPCPGGSVEPGFGRCGRPP